MLAAAGPRPCLHARPERASWPRAGCRPASAGATSSFRPRLRAAAKPTHFCLAAPATRGGSGTHSSILPTDDWPPSLLLSSIFPARRTLSSGSPVGSSLPCVPSGGLAIFGNGNRRTHHSHRAGPGQQGQAAGWRGNKGGGGRRACGSAAAAPMADPLRPQASVKNAATNEDPVDSELEAKTMRIAGYAPRPCARLPRSQTRLSQAVPLGIGAIIRLSCACARLDGRGVDRLRSSASARPLFAATACMALVVDVLPLLQGRYYFVADRVHHLFTVRRYARLSLCCSGSPLPSAPSCQRSVSQACVVVHASAQSEVCAQARETAKPSAAASAEISCWCALGCL